VTNRRKFFKTIAAVGMLSAPAVRAAKSLENVGASESAGDRAYWISVAEKLATPVLGHLVRRELKLKMPVETSGSAEHLKNYTHLEAFGRLLVGLSPWLELTAISGSEHALQQKIAGMAREGLDAATDPTSPDFMNFCTGGQPLVDTAFLSQAFLRAPKTLLEPLDTRVRKQVIAALKASRIRVPMGNNHILFAALVETALLQMGEPTLEERLEKNLRQMLAWYKGDGAYGDGEFFRFDYYNSFVIQPALLDILDILRQGDSRFEAAYNSVLARSRRFAQVQERLIAPDGTFPSIGRSTTYRFGAFQTLAQMALRKQLVSAVSPAQVRCGLTAVIRRMIEMPYTFDRNGWLHVGFCGSQVTLGEHYISTGSQYLCTVGLLPLGLPPGDPFWSDPPARWTSQRLWSGESLPADSALHDDGKPVDVPTLKR
jgi:hypothetical protein